MKTLTMLLCVAALAAPAFGVDSAPQTSPPAPVAKNSGADMIPISAAKISAPFVAKEGVVSQPAQTDVGAGGKAVFDITVPKDGEYVINAIVNAPDEDSNSFYLNIDGQPEDPVMIWDIAVTKGFEKRVVSWRGSGDDQSDEFSPKRFKLTAGAHKIIIVGREPAQLKSIAIEPAAH